MNNTCPTCGAVYNVAMKDVGRKIKGKKCSTALRETEKGLEEEDGRGPSDDPKPAAVVEADDRDDRDDDDRPAKKAKREKAPRGPGVDPMAALSAIGGPSTIAFGFGVFLVIVFTALPIIGTAGTDRANAYVDKLKLEQATKVKALIPKGKKLTELSADELKKYDDETKKINDDFEKQIADAGLDAERTKIGNRRDVWMEMYGLMFGFIFVSFGCIGYLRTEQPLVLKIVAAVILGIMMIIMFGKGGGCGMPRGPQLHTGAGGSYSDGIRVARQPPHVAPATPTSRPNANARHRRPDPQV